MNAILSQIIQGAISGGHSTPWTAGVWFLIDYAVIAAAGIGTGLHMVITRDH